MKNSYYSMVRSKAGGSHICHCGEGSLSGAGVPLPGWDAGSRNHRVPPDSYMKLPSTSLLLADSTRYIGATSGGFMNTVLKPQPLPSVQKWPLAPQECRLLSCEAPSMCLCLGEAGGWVHSASNARVQHCDAAALESCPASPTSRLQ